jgi:hypothetical protein
VERALSRGCVRLGDARGERHAHARLAVQVRLHAHDAAVLAHLHPPLRTAAGLPAQVGDVRSLDGIAVLRRAHDPVDQLLL